MNGIELKAAHIPGKRNMVADYFSQRCLRAKTWSGNRDKNYL